MSPRQTRTEPGQRNEQRPSRPKGSPANGELTRENAGKDARAQKEEEQEGADARARTIVVPEELAAVSAKQAGERRAMNDWHDGGHAR